MSEVRSEALTGPKPGRVKTAVVLGSLSAFGPLSMDMYLPSLPKLAEDLHAGASTAQLSLTSCLLGLSLGQLFAGPLSDAAGRRKPLLLGLGVYALASLLCAWAPTAWALVLLRFLQGAAGSAGIVISRAAARDLYAGTELTRFYALLMLVNGTAPILAPIVGGQLLEVTSWRGVFVVLCAIGLLVLLAVLFALPETLPEERRTSGLRTALAGFRRLAGNRVFMGYALSQGLVSAAMFTYISGSPFVLQEIYGVSPQLFSLCFAMNGLGIIAAGQITGRLAGRISESRLFAAGLGLAFLGGLSLLAAVLSGGGLAAILPALFLVVSSVGVVSTAGVSLAMRDHAKSAGSASALLGVLSFITGGILAPFAGIAGKQTAVPMGLIIAAAETSALLCYFFLVRRGEGRPPRRLGRL